VWLDEESPRRGGALQASLEFVGALGLLLFASLRGILQARPQDSFGGARGD